MKNNYSKTLVVLIGICILTSSCYKNFYFTNSQNSLSSKQAEIVNTDSKKFVIVHFSDRIFELTKYTITNETIEGEINKIEIPEHLIYLNPQENSSNSYKKRFESAVLNEVHIYTPLKSNSENTNHIQLTSKDITRIDIYQKDKKRTSVNHILSTLGITGGVVTILTFFAFTLTLGALMGPII